jgi:hypothetical protein
MKEDTWRGRLDRWGRKGPESDPLPEQRIPSIICEIYSPIWYISISIDLLLLLLLSYFILLWRTLIHVLSISNFPTITSKLSAVAMFVIVDSVSVCHVWYIGVIITYPNITFHLPSFHGSLITAGKPKQNIFFTHWLSSYFVFYKNIHINKNRI